MKKAAYKYWAHFKFILLWPRNKTAYTHKFDVVKTKKVFFKAYRK